MILSIAICPKSIFFVVVLMAWNSIMSGNSVDMFDVEGFLTDGTGAPGRWCTHGY
jgi:hypothetical protein